MRKISTATTMQGLRAGVAVFLLAALATACADGTRSPAPDGAASFVGVIAAREASSVLLVATTQQPAGADRASVRVHAGTRLSHASGQPATADDLQVGRQVRAWFDGPVMESYPVQATAGAIVIDPQ